MAHNRLFGTFQIDWLSGDRIALLEIVQGGLWPFHWFRTGVQEQQDGR
jgi:hypothetical protein